MPAGVVNDVEMTETRRAIEKTDYRLFTVVPPHPFSGTELVSRGIPQSEA